MSIKPILFNTEMVRAILDGSKTVTRRIVKTKAVSLYLAHGGNLCGTFEDNPIGDKIQVIKPKYQVGDTLYVREAFCPNYFDDCIASLRGGNKNAYRADYNKPVVGDVVPEPKWHPSLHMPKTAARIFLEVTDVRVERLQDITDEQALKEGIARMYDHLSKEEYEDWAKRIGRNIQQEECPWNNYLWHGNFGNYGCGNKLSDAWAYQFSAYNSPIGSFSSLWNITVKLEEWKRFGWNANPWVWVYEFERCEKPEGWCI